MDDGHYDLADLSAGASYYDDARNTVYYRGNSTNTSVSLPDGKAVVSITPAYEYSIYDGKDGTCSVVFAHAISFDVMVEIVLKDED